MKLSEYIKKLENELEEYGDVEVKRHISNEIFVTPLYAGSIQRLKADCLGHYEPAEKGDWGAFLALVV